MENKRKIWHSITSIIAIGLGVFGLIILSGMIALSAAHRSQRIEMENIYQRSFFEICDNLNNVEMNLSKMLVSNSSQESGHLATMVSKQADSVECGINTLPVDGYSIMSTTKFFNQVSDWCSVYSKNCYKGAKITEENEKMIEDLYVSVRTINDSVKDMAGRFQKNNYKIINHLNVGRIGAEADFSFAQSEEEATVEYPQMIYDGPFSDSINATTHKATKGLVDISLEKAKEMALNYLKFAKNHESTEYDNAESNNSANKAKDSADNNNQTTDSQVPSDIKEINLLGISQGEIGTYEMEAKGADDYYISLSVKGGLPIMISCDRAVMSAKLGKEQAIARAEQIGADMKLENCKAVWYNMIDGVALVNLAPVIDDITYYTDLVKVKIALDNGDLLGLEMTSYCKNHETRSYKPTINDKTARSLVSPKLAITNSRLAVVPHGINKEVLTFEIEAEYKGLDYFVYINAKDGSQVNIMRVVDEEQGKMII